MSQNHWNLFGPHPQTNNNYRLGLPLLWLQKYSIVFVTSNTLIWTCDICNYKVGQLYGHHKTGLYMWCSHQCNALLSGKDVHCDRREPEEGQDRGHCCSWPDGVIAEVSGAYAGAGVSVGAVDLLRWRKAAASGRDRRASLKQWGVFKLCPEVVSSSGGNQRKFLGRRSQVFQSQMILQMIRSKTPNEPMCPNDLIPIIVIQVFQSSRWRNVSQVTSRLNPNLISWGQWGGDVNRACDAYPPLYDCSHNLFPMFWPALYKWLRNDRPTRRSFRDHIKWSFPYKMNFQKIFPSIVSIGFFRDDIFCDFLRDRIVWRIICDWKTRLCRPNLYQTGT